MTHAGAKQKPVTYLSLQHPGFWRGFQITTFCAAMLSANAVVADDVTMPVLQDKSADSRDAIVEARKTWQANDLQAALLENPQLNAFDIRVTIDDEKVRLSGNVKTDAQRKLAEDIVSSFSDVEYVNNAIRVVHADKPSPSSLQDSVINARVSVKLMADDTLSTQRIDIDTVQNVVTLGGEVDSEEQKDHAATVASNVEGVRRVKNKLVVVDH